MGEGNPEILPEISGGRVGAQLIPLRGVSGGAEGEGREIQKTQKERDSSGEAQTPTPR